MSAVKVAATSAVAIRPVGVANVVLGEIVKFADLDFAQRTDANGVWLANYALVRWAPLIDALVRWFPVERHQDPTVHQLPGGHLWWRTAMEVVAQQFLRKRGDCFLRLRPCVFPDTSAGAVNSVAAAVLRLAWLIN